MFQSRVKTLPSHAAMGQICQDSLLGPPSPSLSTDSPSDNLPSSIPPGHRTYHRDVIVALNNLPDFPHFLLHIAGPDLTDYLTGICKCGWHIGRSGRELKQPQQSCRSREAANGDGSVTGTSNSRIERDEREAVSRCSLLSFREKTLSK